MFSARMYYQCKVRYVRKYVIFDIEYVSYSSDVTMLYVTEGPSYFSHLLPFQHIGLPNVSILDGGFVYWKKLGYETETGEPADTEVLQSNTVPMCTGHIAKLAVFVRE